MVCSHDPCVLVLESLGVILCTIPVHNIPCVLEEMKMGYRFTLLSMAHFYLSQMKGTMYSSWGVTMHRPLMMRTCNMSV